MSHDGRDGHIELDWAIDAIRVGARARHDLGDLSDLVDSIKAHGFLQPITITPDGVLLCGQRRLAAGKQLGLRTVSVWVRTGISSRLQRLVAEQDENTVRKALLPTEAADLYRELKQVLAEDATRRQQVTRFGGDAGADSGAAGSAAPRGGGDARRQAARQVTGSNSYTRLEQVGRAQQVAEDASLPDDVRHLAATALEGMDSDGKVDRRYRQVRDAVDEARQQRVADLAREAVVRATGPVREAVGTQTASAPGVPRPLGVRAFLLTWTELSGWSDRFDPTRIGPKLTAEQWAVFTRTVEETVTFLERGRDARSISSTDAAAS